jgi:hypothetical protein
MSRRKNPRFTVDYLNEYFEEHYGNETRVLDLSKEGARLSGNVPVAKGAYLKMVIELQNPSSLLRVDLATTRWSKGKEFGVEFIRMDPYQQERLHDWLQGFAVEESPVTPAVS